MPRGGARPGAGRKPKFPRPATVTPLTSSAAMRMAPPTTNDPSPIEEFDAPDSLSRDEREVWLKQAPHAFRNRTLTRATAMAFERYCRMVVAERAEDQSSARNGSNHRGLRREINSLELQFMLTPCGKPMPDVARTQTTPDEDESFFGDGRAAG